MLLLKQGFSKGHFYILLATILFTFLWLNNSFFQCPPWVNANLAFYPKDHKRTNSCPSPEFIKTDVILFRRVLYTRSSQQLLGLNAQGCRICLSLRVINPYPRELPGFPSVLVILTESSNCLQEFHWKNQTYRKKQKQKLSFIYSVDNWFIPWTTGLFREQLLNTY